MSSKPPTLTTNAGIPATGRRGPLLLPDFPLFEKHSAAFAVTNDINTWTNGN